MADHLLETKISGLSSNLELDLDMCEASALSLGFLEDDDLSVPSSKLKGRVKTGGNDKANPNPSQGIGTTSAAVAEIIHHHQKDTTFTKLFVGGLPYHTTDESLKEHFSIFGEIDEAVVINDRQTGKSRGYGFVIMSDKASAERACKETNPIIDGRKANVNLAILGAKPRGAVNASTASFAFPVVRSGGYPAPILATNYGLPAVYQSNAAAAYQQALYPGNALLASALAAQFYDHGQQPMANQFTQAQFATAAAQVQASAAYNDQFANYIAIAQAQLQAQQAQIHGHPATTVGYSYLPAAGSAAGSSVAAATGAMINPYAQADSRLR